MDTPEKVHHILRTCYQSFSLDYQKRVNSIIINQNKNDVFYPFHNNQLINQFINQLINQLIKKRREG